MTDCSRLQLLSDVYLGCIHRSNSALFFRLPPFCPFFQQAAFPHIWLPFYHAYLLPLLNFPTSFILPSWIDEGHKMRKNCGAVSLTQARVTLSLPERPDACFSPHTWSSSHNINMVLDNGSFLSGADNRSGETVPKCLREQLKGGNIFWFTVSNVTVYIQQAPLFMGCGEMEGHTRRAYEGTAIYLLCAQSTHRWDIATKNTLQWLASSKLPPPSKFLAFLMISHYKSKNRWTNWWM